MGVDLVFGYIWEVVNCEKKLHKLAYIN